MITLEEALTAFSLLEVLRDKGWRVAVHNDYRQDGQDMTFWLLTRVDSHLYVKGEGTSDADALRQCAADAETLFTATPKKENRS